METSQWLSQLNLKNLLNQNNQWVTEALDLNLESLSVDLRLNVIYMALYILAMSVKNTAARSKASAAVFLCVGLSYSPLFYILNEIQYYAMLSIIYSVTTRSITNKKIKSACSIMALFELAMVIDSGVANGYETWLSINYQAVTTCIHFIILSSFVKWDLSKWRNDLERLAGCLRSVLRSASNKAALWYYC